MPNSMEILTNPPETVWRVLADQFVATDGWDFSDGDYTNWMETIDLTFLIAVDKETKDPLASISIAKWKHRDSGELFYHIGQFYVKIPARNRGIGQKLFKMVMDMAGEENVGLTGVLTMTNKYETVFGFDKILEPWQMIILFRPDDAKLLDLSNNGIEIKNIDEVNMEKIHEYDAKICILDRKKYLEKNLKHPKALSLVATKSDKIVGFICIKLATRNNVNISGFYADDQEIAMKLLNEGVRKLTKLGVPMNQVELVFPSSNHRVMEIVNKILHGKFVMNAWDRQQFTKKVLVPPSELVYSVIDGAHSYV